MTTKSIRKPHNHLAGYVCELKSQHRLLPGYFVIFDRDNGGETITGTDGQRWGVAHMQEDLVGGVITFKALPDARGLMKAMATGSNLGDYGQSKGNVQLLSATDVEILQDAGLLPKASCPSN